MVILSRSFVFLAVAGESEIATDFSVAWYVSEFSTSKQDVIQPTYCNTPASVGRGDL